MAQQDDIPYIVVEREGSNLGAFLFGAAVGAVTALLFAPKSGEETRRELEEGARKAREDAEKKLAELREEVEEAYDRARDEFGDRMSQAKSELQGRKRRAETAYRAGREAAGKARSDLERRMAEAKAARKAEQEKDQGDQGEKKEADEEGSQA